MEYVDFIKEHWVEILIGLSLAPVVIRAVLRPDKGTKTDRVLSMAEALVLDVRKVLKSFGVATPGGSVEPPVSSK